MNFEAAMIPITRPAFFSKVDVRRACDFIMSADKPPSHVQCDFDAIKRKAMVVKWAMGNAWQDGE